MSVYGWIIGGLDDFISDRKLKLLLAIYIQQVRSRQFQVVWKSFELEAAMLEQELFLSFHRSNFLLGDKMIFFNKTILQFDSKSKYRENDPEA